MGGTGGGVTSNESSPGRGGGGLAGAELGKPFRLGGGGFAGRAGGVRRLTSLPDRLLRSDVRRRRDRNERKAH